MDKRDERNYLPSCWSEEERMNAMFTVFRSKDANPTGWQEKMNFWIKSILHFCCTNRKVSVTASEICSAFRRNGKEPKCINEVLYCMHKEGTVIPSAEFAYNSSTWLGWGYSLLRKPVSDSYSFVKSMLFDSSNKELVEERYILLDVLKHVAGQVFSRQKELEKVGDVENIVEVNDFKKHISDICTGDDFEFVLQQLKQEKKVAILCDRGEQYVKFRSDEPNSIQPITDVDKAIVRLRKTSDIVDSDINVIEKEIEKCVAEAKGLLKVGNKAKAMMAIKRKKRLEIALKKKTISADNLESILLQLKNTGSQKLIMQAYSAGVNVMKNRMKTDLDIDKADEIMNDFQETIGDIAEINTIMSKSLSTEEDMSDLDQELEELLAKDKPPVKQREKTAEEMDAELMQRLEALKKPEFPLLLKEKVAVKNF